MDLWGSADSIQPLDETHCMDLHLLEKGGSLVRGDCLDSMDSIWQPKWRLGWLEGNVLELVERQLDY